MKKLLLISVIISLFSCEKNSISTQEEFIEIAIPDQFIFKPINLETSNKSNQENVDIEVVEVKVINDDGDEVFGKFRFTMPADESVTLISLEITANLITDGNLDPSFFENYDGTNDKLGCFPIAKKFQKVKVEGFVKQNVG